MYNFTETVKFCIDGSLHDIFDIIKDNTPKEASKMKESEYLEDNEKIIADLKKMPVFEPLKQEDLKFFLKMSKLQM